MLDQRMLQKNAYVHDETTLLRIKEVRKLGKHPNQRLVIRAENCKTLLGRTLTSHELSKFEFVTRAACDVSATD